MKRRLILPHSAESDLDSHFIYLAENASLEIAIRFDDSTEASLSRLLDTPFIGARRDEHTHDLRMWFVKDFEDYLIFYRVTDEAIEVVRVLHSSQDVKNILASDAIS